MTPDEALTLLYDECDHYTDAVLAVRAEVDRLRAQRDVVLALHQPEPVTLLGGKIVQMCTHCSTGDPYCTVSDQWPCPTAEAAGVES